MRTTLEIEDEIFRRAKMEAARRGRSLGQVVTEALRDALKAEEKTSGQFIMPVFGNREQPVKRTADELAKLRDEGR